MALGDVNHVLSNGDSSNGDSTITYTCESVTNGTALYRKTGTTSGDHTISYNATSGWSDVGIGQPRLFGDAVTSPVQITPGPTVTKLYLWTNDFGSLICVLNTGYSSGPGTLSVVPTEFTTSVPSGVTPFDGAGPELYYTIAKTEANGQYNIYMDDVYYATATHTNGSVSSGQVPGRSFALNAKMYFGQVYTSSSLNTLVTEFTWPTIKKVFCNFW